MTASPFDGTGNLPSGQVFLGRDGRVFGPFTQAQVEDMRKSGELLQYHWMWDGTGQWTAANPPPPPPPGLPAAAAPIATPSASYPDPDSEKTEEFLRPEGLNAAPPFSRTPISTEPTAEMEPNPALQKQTPPGFSFDTDPGKFFASAPQPGEGTFGFAANEPLESEPPAPPVFSTPPPQPPQFSTPKPLPPPPAAKRPTAPPPAMDPPPEFSMDLTGLKTPAPPKTQPQKAAAPAATPVSGDLSAFRAVCFDRRKLLNGTITRASAEGCILQLRVPIVPMTSGLTPGRPLWLNLIDERSGRSENVRTVLTSGVRRDGKLELKLKWAATPRLLAARAQTA